MPIFEYECRGCGHDFEQLVRPGDTPACPACVGRDLEKLLSLASVSSDGIREANVAKARLAAKPMQREKAAAEAEEIREHYGPDALKAMQPKPLRKK